MPTSPVLRLSPELQGLDGDLLRGIGPHFESWTDTNAHAILIARHGKLVYEHYFTGEDWSWGKALGRVAYDATKRHFVPRQAGYEGPAPDSVETLTMDHEQIKFRKGHLAAYLARLVTAPYDGKMVGYLDFVGKMHTAKAGSKEISVPLVQMNALMGFVSDALLATLLGLGVDGATKARAARAFNKLLWLQNDLITRHYAA